MALRIYPIRPLRPRGYYGAQNQSPYAGAFKAGSSFGNELVSGIGKAMAARKAQQQQDALNAQANRLMNTSNPALGTVAPRAGAVGPVADPRTGQIIGSTPQTTGTAPFSTGTAGVALQQAFIKNQLDNQKLAQEVRNSGIASNMAARRGGGGAGGGGGGDASRWQTYLGGGGQDTQGKGKAGKTAAYQANSATPNDAAYYDFNHQRTDVDAQYGKGTHDRLLAGAGQLGPPDPKTGIRTTGDGTDTKPPSMTVDKDGNVTLAPKGNYGGASIPATEVQKNMARNDATAVQKGGSPKFSDQYLKTQHPEAGLPGGDPANPYTPKDILELNAIPPGKWFVNPQDGKVNQKTPPAQPPAQKISQANTGDQGQGLVSAPPQVDTGAQPQGLVGGGVVGAQPPTPQQGLASGDQGQGQDYTGGQVSQLSPVAPQPPVDLASVSPSNAPGSFFPGGTPPSGGLPPDLQLGDEIKRSQMADYLQGVA